MEQGWYLAQAEYLEVLVVHRAKKGKQHDRLGQLDLPVRFVRILHTMLMPCSGNPSGENKDVATLKVSDQGSM